MTLVNMTNNIQSTALSIPLAFASRATHTSKARFNAKRTIGIIKMEPQTAQPAAAAGSDPLRDVWANATEASNKGRTSWDAVRVYGVTVTDGFIRFL